MNCKCGFPAPPPPRTMREGFLSGFRVIKEHEIRCVKCGNVNKVRG